MAHDLPPTPAVRVNEEILNSRTRVGHRANAIASGLTLWNFNASRGEKNEEKTHAIVKARLGTSPPTRRFGK
jgi:hypothetical protein